MQPGDHRLRHARRGFNPHPASQPDATRICSWGRLPRTCFNPHPASQPDATVPTGQYLAHVFWFQSSPGLSAGCNWMARLTVTLLVSFQSSPGLSAGCNTPGAYCLRVGLVGFNPHPASQPDATSTPGPQGHIPPSRFNPHPASQPDATLHSSGGSQAGSGFNPHPASQPDATIRPRCPTRKPGVSILTRPLSRMQHDHPASTPGIKGWFQSSPGLSAGCNLPRPGVRHPQPSFNPHPASQPDATGAVTVNIAVNDGFNPHPASQPDATVAAAKQ